MTDKPTLEEIEARLAECDEARRDVLTGGYGVRLLEICREQGAEIARLRKDLDEANECRDPAYFAQIGKRRRR